MITIGIIKLSNATSFALGWQHSAKIFPVQNKLFGCIYQLRILCSTIHTFLSFQGWFIYDIIIIKCQHLVHNIKSFRFWHITFFQRLLNYHYYYLTLLFQNHSFASRPSKIFLLFIVLQILLPIVSYRVFKFILTDKRKSPNQHNTLFDQTLWPSFLKKILFWIWML